MRTVEEISGRVTGTERVQISGVELDAFVIESREGAGQKGTFWFVTQSTLWFAPELGVAVRENRTVTETEIDRNPPLRREATWELLSWPGGPAA